MSQRALPSKPLPLGRGTSPAPFGPTHLWVREEMVLDEQIAHQRRAAAQRAVAAGMHRHAGEALVHDQLHLHSRSSR